MKECFRSFLTSRNPKFRFENVAELHLKISNKTERIINFAFLN